MPRSYRVQVFDCFFLLVCALGYHAVVVLGLCWIKIGFWCTVRNFRGFIPSWVKRFMSVFAKEEAPTGSFRSLICYNLLLLPFISFGLTHHCLKAELHCTAAKLKGRFLMKMNALKFIFFVFVIFVIIGTFFINNLYT